MTMMTQALADAAIEVARGCRVSGSGNKLYAPAALGVALGQQRKQVAVGQHRKLFQATTRKANQREADTELTDLRNGFRPRTLEDWLYYAEQIKWVGAGNCGELSIVAFAELYTQGVRPLYSVHLAPPGDHQFAIVGTPKVHYDSQHGWGCDLTNWGDRVWVLDPWANIGCKAPQYKHAWAKKMGKWSEAHKAVSYQGNWIDPRRADWVGAIGNCDVLKVSLEAL